MRAAYVLVAFALGLTTGFVSNYRHGKTIEPLHHAVILPSRSEPIPLPLPTQSQIPAPPPGLPTAVTVSVIVNGTMTGSYPLTWNGIGWNGSAVVSNSTIPVFLNYHQTSSPQPLPEYTFSVSAPGEGHYPRSGFYGNVISVTPLAFDADVSFAFRSLLPGAAVTFVFRG